MRTKILLTTALLASFLVSQAPALASSAATPSPQAASTSCARLYGYVGSPVHTAHGVVDYPVFITNISLKECTIAGVPTVTYNEGAALTANRVTSAQRGGPATLSAASGAVYVVISVLPTTKWSHARCAPTKASSATLSFGNAAHINVTTNFQICSKFASSTISGVAPLSIPIS